MTVSHRSLIQYYDDATIAIKHARLAKDKAHGFVPHSLNEAIDELLRFQANVAKQIADYIGEDKS